MEKLTNIRIDRRFCGPPGYGNGGYVCGLLAKHFSGQPIEVAPTKAVSVPQIRLHAPVPLDSSLDLWRRQDNSLQLRSEETLVATCRLDKLSLQIPMPLDYMAATEVAKTCRGLSYHPFPDCFVCGPERKAGEGLRIFPGRIAETDLLTSGNKQFQNLVAATWIPDNSLSPQLPTDDNLGYVASEFIWAALDCTGSFSVDFSEDKILVLGEFKVQLLASPEIGEPCVVMGWLKRVEGRKHFAATAVYNSREELCGLGEAIWIQI